MSEQPQVRPLEAQIIGPDAPLMLSAIEKTSADNKNLRALVVRLATALEELRLSEPKPDVKFVQIPFLASAVRSARAALAAVPPKLRGEKGEKL